MIKYPRLIITGEIIKIIELTKNNICCNKYFFLVCASKIDIINPNIVTSKEVNTHKIKEFKKESIKYFLVKITLLLYLFT